MSADRGRLLGEGNNNAEGGNLHLLFPPCLEFKFTQTAVLEESTSQIDFTPKTSSHPSSNSSCPLPASLAVHRCEHIEKADDYEKLSVQPQSPIIRFKATHLKRELRSALFFRFLVADGPAQS